MAQPNSRLGADHYVPILKCKQGELGALNTANPQRLMPLIELPDRGRVSGLISAWHYGGHSILVHPLNLEAVDDSAWASEIDGIFDDLRASSVSAVPVVTADEGIDSITAVRGIAQRDNLGVCVRLDSESLALDTPANVKSELDQLLSDLDQAPDSIDLVLDSGLVRSSVVARVTTAEAALRVLPYMQAWRNLILTFSAFPETMDGIAPKSSVTAVDREDAIAFATLISRNPDREPVFGDYAVGVPFYSDMPWTPIPSIRYTEDRYWMIHRGATKANRSAQYVGLAQDIVSAPYFSGRHFSAGDEYFDDVATGSVGPGNPMTYVRANTSHHLAAVLHRLATLGVP
jgi:hypothetical protein